MSSKVIFKIFMIYYMSGQMHTSKGKGKGGPNILLEPLLHL